MSRPEKRCEIVRAALELIAEHGYHGAPMALIAERAGVGAGTIYRYFENKDVLIAELYRGLEAKISQAILPGYEPAKPIRERFLHLWTALLCFFIEHPLEFRYLQQFQHSPYGVAHRRDKLLGENRENDIFRQLFTDGVAQQVMKDLPLPVLFALAFGPLLAVARDHILGFYTLSGEGIAASVAACWDGVRR